MENQTTPTQQPNHYHGDNVRILLLLAGVIMLVSLPLYKNTIPIYPTILASMVIVMLAGLTYLRYRWVAILNVLVSLGGIAVFEYAVVFMTVDKDEFFFILNQALAIVFFFSAYYSIKTLRWMYAQPGN